MEEELAASAASALVVTAVGIEGSHAPAAAVSRSPFAFLLCWTAREVRRSSPGTRAPLSTRGEEGERGAMFFECFLPSKRKKKKKTEKCSSALCFRKLVGRKKRQRQKGQEKNSFSLFVSALSPSLWLCFRHDREAPEPVSFVLLKRADRREAESEETSAEKKRNTIDSTNRCIAAALRLSTSFSSLPPLSFEIYDFASSSATASSASPSRTRPRSPTSSAPSTRPRESPRKTPRSPSTRPSSLPLLSSRPPSPRSTRPPPPRPPWPRSGSPTAPCCTSTTPSSATSPPSPGPRRKPSGPR